MHPNRLQCSISHQSSKLPQNQQEHSLATPSLDQLHNHSNNRNAVANLPRQSATNTIHITFNNPKEDVEHHQ